MPKCNKIAPIDLKSSNVLSQLYEDPVFFLALFYIFKVNK